MRHALQAKSFQVLITMHWQQQRKQTFTGIKNKSKQRKATVLMAQSVSGSIVLWD